MARSQVEAETLVEPIGDEVRPSLEGERRSPLDHLGALPASRNVLSPRSRTIVMIVAGLYALVGLVVVLVDLAEISALSFIDGNYPMWYQLFNEGSPIEWLQGAVLLGLIFWAAVIAERARGLHKFDLMSLMTLLAVSGALLAIEDAGNVGERLAHWVGEAVGRDSRASDVVRVPVLGAIALVPSYALWRYRSVLSAYRRLASYLLAGYAIYAVMGIGGELINHVVPFYEVVGNFLLDDIARGELDPGPTANMWAGAGFVFMDDVYEESLELAAGTFLLVGVASFARAAVSHRDPEGDMQVPSHR